MKIIDYCLVRAIQNDWQDENLEEKVKKLINEGWQPQGGVFIIDEEYNTIFYQAMVKYDADAD